MGTPVLVMPKYELKQLCQLVERHKVTILMLVPPIALALARDPIARKHDLGSLRLVISGAAPLGPELENELAGRIPKCDVIQAYGTTRYCYFDPNLVTELMNAFCLCRTHRIFPDNTRLSQALQPPRLNRTESAYAP